MQRYDSETLPFTAEQCKELLQAWNNMGRALISTGHATPLFRGINIASNALYGSQTCDSLFYDRCPHAGNPSIAESSPSCTTIPESPLARASNNQQIIDVDPGCKNTLSAGGHRPKPKNNDRRNMFCGIRTSLAREGEDADGYSHADKGPIPNPASAQESPLASTESDNIRLTTPAFGSTLRTPSSTPAFGTSGFSSTITSAFNCSAVPGSRSSPFALSGPSGPALDQFGRRRKPDPGPGMPAPNSATSAPSATGLASLTTKGGSSIYRATSPAMSNIFGIEPPSKASPTRDASSALDAGNSTSLSAPGLANQGLSRS